MRYHRLIDGEASYHPYLMTLAGSTFHLAPRDREEGTQRELASHLRKLVSAGLLSSDAERGWRQSPFLQENGYGAIEVVPMPETLEGDGQVIRYA